MGAEFHLPADSGGAMPMEPKKGWRGMSMPGAKSAVMLGAVEGDDLGAAVGEVVGEEAAAGAEAVAGEVGVDVDFQDADFEDVAGFGFFDGDGAGEDVAAGAAVGLRDSGVEGGEPGGDLVGGGRLRRLEAVGRAAGGGGLHDDGVAGVDGEDGLGVGGVVAPGDGGGGGEEGGGLGGEEEGRGEGGEEEVVGAHELV